MMVLAVDVGGTHVKVMVSGQAAERKVVSGPTMTAAAMVQAVKNMTADWTYDVVSIGYPGPVVHGAPVKDPANLGPGWVGFDFDAAFGRPVKVINDAAMQALGSDQGGRMLFLGLGTGLGSAMVVDGRVEPLELAHLPYKDKQTYEDVVGLRGLEHLGKKRWRRQVNTIIDELTAALQPDYVVLGGGNARLLGDLPGNTRLGDNTNAFKGGFQLWAAPGSATEPLSVPRLLGDRLVMDSDAALFQAAASEFFLQAIAAVGARGRFMVALSGGSTPRGLYELLSTDPKWRAEVPWDRTHFFWGDERHVPPDHEDSNFRLAQDGLFAAVPVPAANIHRVRSEAPSAAEAASDYERELRAVFQLAAAEVPRLDLIMLGLGPEGHTASLFPGTRALLENQRLVVSNWVGKLYTDRITFTPTVLNAAACVMFMVSGSEKATVLKAILEGPYEPDQLPAQLINPMQGRLVWLLDRAAASALQNGPV